MIIQNSTDIKTKYFFNKDGDIVPVDVQYERHVINPNGLIQLRNLPSKYTKFVVERKDDINTIEYNKVDTIGNKYDFVVDYINGILLFHDSQVGKEVQISYTNSIGRLSISAERVFTNIDNQGNVVETLSTIIENGRQVLSDLDAFGGITKVTEEIKEYISLIRKLIDEGIIEVGNRVDVIENTLKIINAKITSQIYHFSTIKDMQKSTILKKGDLVKVLGYYTFGDGGEASYIISDNRYEWSIDIGGMYANINERSTVNYRQFGASLNGVDDDNNAMLLCHKYADSIQSLDSTSKTVVYTCTVENHSGIIYKKGTKPIECNSNVDLSGSTLIVDDTNATWFGIYKWGDLDSFHWDYEIQDDLKDGFIKDNYVFELPANDALPSNVVLKVDETPYAVRDDDGYLYSVGRSELLVHTLDGIFISPFADDWDMSGGEEINSIITDLSTGNITSEKVFSKLTASYTYIPIKRGKFIGCEVLLKMSPNKYSSVLHVKHHNCDIEDFYFKPDEDKLHNTMYKNSMIYIFDSYNVNLRNIQGFNASGKATATEKATSGYVIRMSNCSDVTVEDCRIQGYWGATAMNSVKNVHFNRCHLNRLDVHDYFYNLTAKDCVFYHHGIQIGYGRGIASFDSCMFYYNYIPLESYPEAYGITLNLTYGRCFEGNVLLNNCNIHVKNAPNNEYNLIQMRFRPDATSITKHMRLPEIRCKNIDIKCPDENLEFNYLKIGGQRFARSGITMPTHVYGESNDNTVIWRYKERAFDWGENKGRELNAIVGNFLRIADTVLSSEGKTSFYNWRYYKCTKSGSLVWSNKPSSDKTIITVGTAEFTKVTDSNWKSRKSYNVGDLILVTSSNFYAPYVFECVKAGISDGQYPIHTSGIVLEGKNDAVNEPDLCWWKYIGGKDSFLSDFAYNRSYLKGHRFIVDGKIFEVIEEITATSYPPFETPWLEEFSYGGGVLKYIGNEWKPKKWYMVGSYCEADGRIYQLEKHDGITTGVPPTKGNKNCVDGDLIWEYVGKVNENVITVEYSVWFPNTHFEELQMIKNGNKVYEVQQLLTENNPPTATDIGKTYMDGTIPVKFYGNFPTAWRVAGNAYTSGHIISDNTFIVICTKSGTTNVNDKWGPLETSSGWGSNGIYVDGTCEWRKLTPTKEKGFWRNSHRRYIVGDVLLVSKAGTMDVFQVMNTITGDIEPTITVLDVNFLNGTTTLKYKGLENTWLANSRYDIGDVVNAGENQYKCVFDGKLVLPNKTIFENITTNLKKGSVFKFDSNVDVPTKKGNADWKVIVNYCDGITNDVKGLQHGVNYFGGTSTINPTINKVN